MLCLFHSWILLPFSQWFTRTIFVYCPVLRPSKGIYFLLLTPHNKIIKICKAFKPSSYHYNQFAFQIVMQGNTISEEIDANLLKMLKEENRSFKETHSFEERFIEYQIIRCNYPGFLPVSCELENYVGPKKISFRVYLSEEILIGHLRAFLKKLLQRRFP